MYLYPTWFCMYRLVTSLRNCTPCADFKMEALGRGGKATVGAKRQAGRGGRRGEAAGGAKRQVEREQPAGGILFTTLARAAKGVETNS